MKFNLLKRIPEVVMTSAGVRYGRELERRPLRHHIVEPSSDGRISIANISSEQAEPHSASKENRI